MSGQSADRRIVQRQPGQTVAMAAAHARWHAAGDQAGIAKRAGDDEGHHQAIAELIEAERAIAGLALAMTSGGPDQDLRTPRTPRARAHNRPMTSTEQTDLRHLPLVDVVADPGQPRKSFDRQALAELAASIASVGLLEPIIVRPVGETFLLVAGERRWRAAAIAGLDTIAAIVRTDLDAASAFELSMIENVVRADMNPIEEAAGYQQLVDGGMTVETIASRLGKTAADIRFRLALLRLDAPIADLVRAGQLGTWDAWHTSRLSVEGQHRVIRAMAAGDLKGPGQVHRFALAVFAQEAEVPMFGELEVEVTPAATIAATRNLRDELGRILDSIARADRLVDGATSSPESIALGAAVKRAAGQLASKVDTAAARTLARQEVLA